MKIYRLPKEIKTIIFDIDSTLYTNASYAFEQNDIQLRHFAKIKNITEDNARKLFTDYRKDWASSHNGQILSMANVFIGLGIPIETSIEWRNKLLEPKKFLSKDKELRNAIKKLKHNFNIICVTNNPVKVARKTLKAIGVSSLIPKIIGLDTCKKSKPSHEQFLLAAEYTNVNNENCISIGDRYDIDIEPALELNMGGILVEGVKDIYTLYEILK